MWWVIGTNAFGGCVRFFSDLHRSIFDPSFYREVLTRSRRRVVLFMLKMLVFTALILCISSTYYITHSERGIAPLVSALFGDMEIRDGFLKTDLPQPYEVSGDALAVLFNRLMGHSRFFGRVPDNFLVVDTRAHSVSGDGAAAPNVILGESAVAFPEMRMEMPYKSLVAGGNFEFTAASVQAFLNKNTVLFLLHFFFVGLFFGAFTLLLSVFFLSLASYIFSTDRAKGYRHFVKLACFAISPVMLGNALVAASGVNAEWTWHLFIIISTIIMFRAMVNTSGKTSEEKKEAV
jgi:hypothetical protein